MTKKAFLVTCLLLFIQLSYGKDLNTLEDKYRRIEVLEINRSLNNNELISYLKDNSSDIRSRTLQALSRIQDVTTINDIVPLLEDKSKDVQSNAVFTLGQIESSLSENVIIKLIESNKMTDDKILSDCFTALSKIGKEKSIEILFKNIDSTSSLIQTSCGYGLGRLFRKNKEFNYNGSMFKKLIGQLKQCTEIKSISAISYALMRFPIDKNLDTKSDNKEIITNISEIIEFLIKFDYKESRVYLSQLLYNYRNHPAFREFKIYEKIKPTLISSIKDNKSDYRFLVSILPALSLSDNNSFINLINDNKDVFNKANDHVRVAYYNNLIQDASLLNEGSKKNAEKLLLSAIKNEKWYVQEVIISSILKLQPVSGNTSKIISEIFLSADWYLKSSIINFLATSENNDILIDELYNKTDDPRVKRTWLEYQMKKAVSNKDIKTLLSWKEKVLNPQFNSNYSFHSDTVTREIVLDAVKQLVPDKLDDFVCVLPSLSIQNDLELIMVMLDNYIELKKIPEELVRYLDVLKRYNLPAINSRVKELYSLMKTKPTTQDIIIDNLPPEKSLASWRKNLNNQWKVVTNKGEIIIKFYPEAYITTYYLSQLASKGFYNGLSFHRVVSNFVIQGGDPRGDGYGGTDHLITEAFSNHPFVEGTVGIANAGKDTGSCQFFICHLTIPHLDGSYTSIGEVIKGMEVVHKIQKEDKIISIEFKLD